MGFLKIGLWPFWVLWVLNFLYFCDGSEISVSFSETPLVVSSVNSATFVFQVLVDGNEFTCSNCSIICKLDDGASSNCQTRKVYYSGLEEGNHTFEVCTSGQGIGCASYNWTVDTIPPTAYVTASSAFTNALSFDVNVSFSEPCSGGGFGCSTVNGCNLLVYGAGQVMPSTLRILEPNIKFSVMVGLSPTVQYGRVILIMDKNFCTDKAGNIFIRTSNSSFFVHFDRRDVSVDVRTRVPERLLQLNNETRTVQATNNHTNLRVYLYFSEPVLNSSAQILSSINTSQGLLLPTNGKTLGNRRFGFLVENVESMAIVTISLESESIISRQGTPVSPIAPITFLYDIQRPMVRLSTISKTRTREQSIPILIKFMKPVFGFNSSHISISGGHVQSFREMSMSIYTIDVKVENEIITINVPENITGDVAGNKNLPSNVLQLRHYSVPIISSVVSTFVSTTFGLTSVAAGLLTISTASLQTVGAFSGSSFSLTSYPARNLFRIACHIQFFALSRWLSVIFPIEYYEFARGLEWSIPYFNLPWETKHLQPVFSHPYASKIYGYSYFENMQMKAAGFDIDDSVSGLPLTPMEYRSFFESQNIKPEAEHILDPSNSNGWREFQRSMFWLGVICGSLIMLHALLLLILKFRKNKPDKIHKGYGALTFPRFEIFLIILALPSICKASTSLVKGGAVLGVIIGIMLLSVASFFLLALFMFLSVGITFGKLLQYKEVHQEGQEFHWYQDIVRASLGPGKRGQWTWNNQPKFLGLIILGPLFEDLRGPPKYMLTQISSGNSGKKRRDQIISPDDETEDAEAPFIQKVFGILRIYYTFLESVKRVFLGIVVGANSFHESSKTPIIVLLSITSFQLFFLVLKKPFIKKKVQLVEIISVASELGVFSTCLVILMNDIPFSAEEEKRIGIFMLSLFLFGYLAQLINEWYALYRQTKRLDPAEKSFLAGLKAISIGFVLFFVPLKTISKLLTRFPMNEDTGITISPGGGVYRSSGSRSSGNTEKPWLKQLRELAKASFSKEGSAIPTDPSTSQQLTRSVFWSGKRSGSSSMTSSLDFKSKPRALYKDLEAIFSHRSECPSPIEL